MTFRARVIAACMIVALAPLAVFAFGARSEIRDQLTAQYRSRIDASTTVIRQDLERQAASIDERLAGLATQLDTDPTVRMALLEHVDRAMLLDYAGIAMRATGLDYLVLLDSAATVISSGHFRNDYDRQLVHRDTMLQANGPVLVQARRPDGEFAALTRARAFTVGNRRFVLAGGIEVDSTFLRELARNTNDQVVLALAFGGTSVFSTQRFENIPTDALNESIRLPFIEEANAQAGEATWTIAHSLVALNAGLRRLDAWFLGAVGAAVLLAILFARILAARISRPLEELAQQTTHVNLDRMDVGFATEREDEIGALSRMLDAMVQRLRVSANRLRAAERRATVGDMARQVNHDIRNGLLPIRNVIRHLGEVAQEAPAELGTVFTEREGTLHGSIAYLENLAGNYARLSPKVDRRPCDLNGIVRATLRDTADSGRIRLNLSDVAPRVAGDPVALRRIIENLTVNAIESLSNGSGSNRGIVTVSTSLARDERGEGIVLAIADTGSGMSPDVLERIFDDFYTTKDRGTGLGLSIVRRLVADMGGRISVDSRPGNGTTFRIVLPKAP